MAEELLNIDNLWVQYETDEGVFKAVNGINLSLNKGENMSVVGETGAGKTTMALSIMRLLPKNIGKIIEGKIEFEGENLLKLTESEIRKRRGSQISMVFQDPMTSLNPVIPVGEQVKEVLNLHFKNQDKKQKDKRVDEIFELVGIPSERKGEYPHQFSGGMKQRVVIAIAIACEPKLLIADEPTTALDVTIQDQILEMIQELRERLNTSLILITHDLGIVAQNCEKVAIMYAGEVIEFGKVEDIFEGENHHPYTVGLFNSIPDITKEIRRLSVIRGLMPDPDNLPNGCKFHPRCSKRMEICKTEEPSVVDYNGHKIKCHLFS